MSSTQGERPTRRLDKVAAAIAAAVLVVALGGVGFALVKANADAQAHIAQVEAHRKVLNAARIEDAKIQAATNAAKAAQENHAQVVAASAAARVAAEKAAAAKVARAAAQAAAVKAAHVAAAQQAAQQAAAPQDPAPTTTGPILCPAGTIAQAVDGNGNESNCQPLGPTGTQCVAYDANNTCTQWYDPNK